MSASRNAKRTQRIYQEPSPISQNLVGEKFGLLTAVERLGRCCGHMYYQCICECGTYTEAPGGQLRSGRRVTCGCQSAQIKHKGNGTPEYKCWSAIKERCFNSKSKHYRHYGGRGITVFPGWIDDFPAFLAEVGPRPSQLHSLDRIENSNGYVPGNVRWATGLEQANNKRNNFRLKIGDEIATVSEWSRRSGVSVTALRGRVKRKWPEKRLLEPMQQKKSRQSGPT
jgi:hypothetical protein